MFRFITWGVFFIWLSIILAVYYILLAAFCYRKEIANLIKGRTTCQKESQTKNNNIEDLEKVVHEVNGILEKAGKEAGKSELLEQLKERLASFAGLRHPTSVVGRPAYRVALTNYIIRYAKTFCGVAFSEEELEEVWEALLR